MTRELSNSLMISSPHRWHPDCHWSYLFHPGQQTEPWYVWWTAAELLVTRSNFPEDLFLHVLDVVPVITSDPGQAHLPQLCQLFLCEFVWIRRGVVEEPVRLLESLELVSNDALEGWTNDASFNWGLADPTHEQINVVNIIVNFLEEIHNILRNERDQGIKIARSSLIAKFSKPSVSWQTVITTSLHVQSRQIQSEVSLSSKQKVCQLLRKESIECLPRLSGQTNQQLIQLIFDYQCRVEELFRDRDFGFLWSKVCHPLDKCVSKPEGCCSEAVNDGRIDVRIVRVTVSRGQRKDVQLVHELCTQYYRKPLRIRYVLHLCYKNPPGLLI